jgi:nitrogen fixation NifU-like protein
VSDDLRVLYQSIILDHNRRPRNFRSIEDAAHADGYNPLCGDRLTVYVRLEGGRIADASFEGSGCAIAKASASLMTEAVVGKTQADAAALIARVRALVSAGDGEPVEPLGDLAALAGVRQAPVRAKCALLAWQTLEMALARRGGTTSSE